MKNGILKRTNGRSMDRGLNMPRKKVGSTLAGPVPQALLYYVNDNDSVDVALYWHYKQGKELADGFAIFWNINGTGKLTPADSSVKVAITSRSYTFHGLPHGRAYTFGIASTNGPTIGDIVQSSSAPDWTDVYSYASMTSGALKRTQEDLAKTKEQVGQIASGFGALGKRLGFGLESMFRSLVKEFGKDFVHVDSLELRDEEGQLFGARNASVEFDLYAHSDSLDKPAYLVEIKSHLKADEVQFFHKKVKFAEDKLNRPIIPLIFALSVKRNAKSQSEKFGIRLIAGSVIE